LIIDLGCSSKSIVMIKTENGTKTIKKVNNENYPASVTYLLYKWVTRFDAVLNHEDLETAPVTLETLQNIVDQQLAGNLQRLILDEMIGRNTPGDKEQFIRTVQLMLTRLLNRFGYCLDKMTNDPSSNLLKELSQTLLNTIHFLQEYYSAYFDMNEKAPTLLISIHEAKIRRLAQELTNKWSNSSLANTDLIELIKNGFIDTSTNGDDGCTYRQLFYRKELLLELLKGNNDTIETISKIFYHFNFNYSGYVRGEFKRLTSQLSSLSTKSERVNMLRTEMKMINQIPARLQYAYDENMPSLKEQLSVWIIEEISYCEAGFVAHLSNNTVSTDTECKIHTTLSVAKLAVLIRLLVVDKIIINPAVAPMIRTVAKTFTTLQREEISFGSLETKYHAPDKATINTMKEMLQKWINILGKL